MKKFSVKILGSNSAVPANNRYPTSQLLNVAEHYYLIDCGEGTQMQCRKFGVKMQRLKTIFISHLHGDHYFGLIGLLNTLHLLGRTQEITIVCPEKLKEILEMQIDVARGKLRFFIHYIFVTGDRQLVYEDGQISVLAIALKHRIPCYGYRFTEKEGLRKYLPKKGGPLGVKTHHIHALKAGKDVELENGQLIKNEAVTAPPPKARSYVFCTDTLPLDSTVAAAEYADLLYHEATFMTEDAERAKDTYHTTAIQAAEVAKKASVDHLLLGHFSARYKSLEPLLNEALEVFPNAHLAYEGKEFSIESDKLLII